MVEQGTFTVRDDKQLLLIRDISNNAYLNRTYFRGSSSIPFGAFYNFTQIIIKMLLLMRDTSNNAFYLNIIIEEVPEVSLMGHFTILNKQLFCIIQLF